MYVERLIIDVDIMLRKPVTQIEIYGKKKQDVMCYIEELEE